MKSGLVDYRSRKRIPNVWVDLPLLWGWLILCVVGLVMVTSASMELADSEYRDALYFLKRQSAFLFVAAVAGVFVYFTPSDYWFRNARWVLLASLVLLLLVFTDLGKEVNGSRRWLDLGWFTVQPAEIVKLAVIVALARYIARRHEVLRERFAKVLKPLGAVAVSSGLLLFQPDFGAAVILMTIALIMLFLAGVRLGQFALLIAGGGALMALLAVAAPYRLERIKIFLDPWSDPYGSGYQLIQSLIAVGRGGWLGEGLGAGIQKLFYLPEAHTDFIFSVIAEELGFVGVVFIVGAYLHIVLRCFAVARRAEKQGLCAGAFFAYGTGAWIGVQAFINIVVAMGGLPTKGTTLPLISVGGSSLVMVFVALAMTQRIHQETLLRDTVFMRLYESRKRNVLR